MAIGYRICVGFYLESCADLAYEVGGVLMLKWFSLICYIMGSYFQLFMRLLGVDVPLLSFFCLIVILWISMDLFNKDKEIYL